MSVGMSQRCQQPKSWTRSITSSACRSGVQGIRAAEQTGRSRICSISNAPWLFPNENMGLNLPFAVGLVLIKLNGTSGQYGRFLAFNQ